MHKVGFTGTQKGLARSQRNSLRDVFKLFSIEGGAELHLGDCVGADAEAYALALDFGFRTIGHPPVESRKRAFCEFDEVRPRADYLVRNQHIVDETTVLIACPSTVAEARRSGTWATVRMARRFARRIIIIPPDGRVVEDRR